MDSDVKDEDEAYDGVATVEDEDGTGDVDGYFVLENVEGEEELTDDDVPV